MKIKFFPLYKHLILPSCMTRYILKHSEKKRIPDFHVSCSTRILFTHLHSNRGERMKITEEKKCVKTGMNFKLVQDGNVAEGSNSISEYNQGRENMLTLQHIHPRWNLAIFKGVDPCFWMSE